MMCQDDALLVRALLLGSIGAYMIRRYRHGYIVRTIDIDLRIYDNSDDDNEHHIRKNDTQE